MRGLLREHAARGGTVLLSSHLLAEVELVADELVVIGRGRIVATGTKADLLGGAATFVRAVGDDGRLGDALSALVVEVAVSDGGFRVDIDPSLIGEAALRAGVALCELRPADNSLEDLFLDLTADTQRDAAPVVDLQLPLLDRANVDGGST
jgi:ABC-2 type transport system ATP-binding protein